jgi:hypothetical protein
MFLILLGSKFQAHHRYRFLLQSLYSIPIKKMTVAPFPKCYRASGRGSAPELLTAAMSLVSISENDVLTVSDFSSCSISSFGRLNGWGSTETRSSYKRDLASLDDSNVSSKCARHHRDQETPTRYMPSEMPTKMLGASLLKTDAITIHCSLATILLIIKDRLPTESNILHKMLKWVYRNAYRVASQFIKKTANI